MAQSCEVCDGTVGQLGRCRDCGHQHNADTTSRRTGGAGSRTHPLSDEDYKRQMRKIEERAAEDSDE